MSADLGYGADVITDGQYTEYMRVRELLSLQRTPDEVVHRDELLFQTVHQATELLLKLACHEVREAADSAEAGEHDRAVRLLGRAGLGIQQVTGLLELLAQISPGEFQRIRVALGNGSGAESPGWRAVRKASERLNDAFVPLCPDQGSLVELYAGSPDAPLYRLAEAMLEWDQRIALWRARHYEVAARLLGEGQGIVGTAGTSVDVIRQRIHKRFFPRLWQARAALTASASSSP
ncbi:hypothetical protein GCM10023321_08070 [Pseudonocardia eucalypti]|uniref:Tryptophan 2,3-dioxygenase n=1 Tax=Pseudonocardia eucalypti TaxID=648755 RepID=A0ABP9PIV7_9PSEU|nr:tryptophan 2,3-dioxygenase [Pseudonocardia eucalypti]